MVFCSVAMQKQGLLKDRTIEAKKHFEGILEELDELCEGVEHPRGKLEYQHYFCGESGQDEENDEAFARLREKLYKLVGRLVRAFAELKPRMNDAGYSASEQARKLVASDLRTDPQLRYAVGDFRADDLWKAGIDFFQLFGIIMSTK